MAHTRTSGITSPPADADLDAMVQLDPDLGGRDRARLREHGTPVWALIAHLRGVGNDAARVARDYNIPEVAVLAAIHY